MKGLKTVSTLMLFCSLPFWAFCQPVFHTNIDNVKENLDEIEAIYGSQIDLDTPDILDFIIPFLDGAVPDNECPAPYPQINQINNGSVSFFWDPIPTADFYGMYYINLNTGASNSFATDIPTADFNNLQGLYLFGFYSNCGDARGASNIIIVDVDIFHPAGIPPIALTCPCETPESIPLYNGFGSTSAQSNYSLPWLGPCENSKYRVRVEGSIADDNGTSSYYSELTFVHRNTSPYSVFLMPDCDINAISSAIDPYYAGSDLGNSYYNVSFFTGGVAINLPDSDLEVSNLILDVCRCRKRTPSNGGRSAAQEILPAESLAVTPNPGGDYTELTYTVSDDSEVAIAVYDVLGKKIKQVLPQSSQPAGSHRVSIDMSDWPKGIYICQLSTPSEQESISLIKQ